MLHLVGVGPGDPELLTLKAARVIAAADVVAWPSTGEGAAFAFEIAGAHVGARAVRLPVSLPMSVDPTPAQAAYDAAAETVRGHIAAGRSVAWLCEGDPLFYGSAIQLFTRLAGRVAVEVVPGVTSLTAAAAVAGLPVAVRNDIVKVLPAPLPDAALAAELSGGAMVAIIKVGRHFDRMRALLEAAGRAAGAVVVEHATTPRQRITPLLSFAHEARPYFSTILSPARGIAP